MIVSCECRVMSSRRGLCDGSILRPEESSRFCVFVCVIFMEFLDFLTVASVAQLTVTVNGIQLYSRLLYCVSICWNCEGSIMLGLFVQNRRKRFCFAVPDECDEVKR